METAVNELEPMQELRALLLQRFGKLYLAANALQVRHYRLSLILANRAQTITVKELQAFRRVLGEATADRLLRQFDVK